ncbi:coil containing protein [Vibrio phage 1.275.O._10N.286.54.E11]|nr:coil containing protein [Vibrio phage 1.275.O._10N.286.54.E11]
MEPVRIMMFREGDTIEFDGYLCDFVKCDALDKPMYQEQGYVDHPRELYEGYAGPVDEPEDIEDEIEDLKEELEELEGDLETQLRAEAKAAGVKSWHVKSVETLKAELGYDS